MLPYPQGGNHSDLENGSMKKVTVRDVAVLSGVSPSTVSRVLNGHPAISPKTQKAVRDACEALNYVPDIAARGLAGHETHTIGIIIPDISNPYFSSKPGRP